MQVKKDVANGIKKASKLAWIPFAIFGVVFITIIITFIIIFTNVRKDFNNDVEYKTFEAPDEIDIYEKIDELLDTTDSPVVSEEIKYNLVVDKIELKKSLDSYFLSSSELRKGYSYARVHVYFENLTDKTMIVSHNKIDLIVDGVAQKNKTYLYDYALPSTVNPKTKIEGYLVYEVKSTAKDFTIKYEGKEYKSSK